MSIVTIRFAVSVVDDATVAPFRAYRCHDGDERGDPCGHTHRTKSAVLKCAKSLAQGSTLNAGERIEVRSVRP